MQTWHNEEKSEVGIMRYVQDSPAWKHVDKTWPTFASEPRNVRMGLAMDGVNPHKLMRKPNLIWPVLLINYNIPPWLAIKKNHIMLALIMPGPKAPKNPDVYMAPLIDELLEGWAGVLCHDVLRRQENEGRFMLRFMLLWTITDWPGLGSASGLKVSGYNACPTCGKELHGRYSTKLKKMEFLDHRMHLCEDHPLRHNTVFWPTTETRPCPQGPSPEAQLQLCDLMEDGLITKTDAGINRRSILWTLPYWRVMLFPH